MNVYFDLTDLIMALLGLLGTFITIKVIPWIKTNYTKDELEKAMMWAQIAVNAAEQLAKNGTIKLEERKEYAMNILVSKGIKIDMDQLSNIVESFVLELPELLDKEVPKKDDKIGI